jgi:hypothetical protein
MAAGLARGLLITASTTEHHADRGLRSVQAAWMSLCVTFVCMQMISNRAPLTFVVAFWI